MVSDLRLMAMARQLGHSATAETDSQLFAEAAQLSSELAEKEKNLEEAQVQAQLFEAQVKVSHSIFHTAKSPVSKLAEHRPKKMLHFLLFTALLVRVTWWASCASS